MTSPDVVIVTADTRDLVLRCVEHLGDHNAIVVDNASKDGTAEALEGRARVVRLDEPVGYAAACNRGAAAGNSEQILFLNSDIIATPGAVERLVAALDENPEAVAAAGRLVDPGTHTPQSAYEPKAFPTLATFAVRLSGIEQLWPRNPVSARRGEQLAGACLLVHRSAFEQVGGWDEDYWFWYEDVDLSKRLRDLGPLLHVGVAEFEHVGGASFARWSRAQTIDSLHGGIERYVAKHFSRPRRAIFALLLIALSAPRAVIFTAIDRDLARVHARVVARAVRSLW